ncbi:hypothetical protein CR513_46861, partial [Mucuna pruriens]
MFFMVLNKHHVLGIIDQVKQEDNRIHIYQQKYTKELFKKFKMETNEYSYAYALNKDLSTFEKFPKEDTMRSKNGSTLDS